MKVKVISLALHANENLRKNASEVIKEINAGEHPYKDKNIPSLWVWLFDTDLKIIAHPNSRIVGKVRKGVPDVKGKMYRDEILKGALKNGSGWVEYHYPKPGRRGYFKKSCYYVLSKASNGKKYIVCSAYYLD
jgi:polar amino acid transport system substrate-binding protein